MNARLRAGTVGTALLAGVLASSVAPADEAVFAIGNSLTLDCCGDGAIAAFATSDGMHVRWGEHVKLGASLPTIEAAPTDQIGMPADAWNAALPTGAWRTLMVEPYTGADATLGADVSAIQDFVSSALAGGTPPARLVLYAAWPARPEVTSRGSFTAAWNRPAADADSQPTTLARAYYDRLQARLARAYGSTLPVTVVAVGDVFAALERRIAAGEFADVGSVAALYRDDNHLGDAGRYLAGVTVYAALTGRDPTALPVPAQYAQGYAGVPLTPDLARRLAALAWSVVAPPPAPPPAAVAAMPTGGGGATDAAALVLLAALAAVRAARRREHRP
jgi:hypothetical protein